jgi:NAD(P)-dependent dehydrogenase (short-subunit alcohol dehydrogenase family)
MLVGGTVRQSVAVIAGGAQGLGAATARQMASRGLFVVLVDIDEAAVNRIADECGHLGPGGHAIAADLGKAETPQRMIAEALSTYGRIDVLINCAAVAPVEPFLEMTAGNWDAALRVNVRAVALGMAAAGRVMAAARSGHIVNVTSAAARMALPNSTAYAATKAAVDVVTRNGAVALASYGIRVNSFSPGMMNTPMQEKLEAALCRLEGGNDLAEFRAERTRRVPLGRRTDPEEMAAALTWLALDSPPYMTAERFNVTGGLDKD